MKKLKLNLITSNSGESWYSEEEYGEWRDENSYSIEGLEETKNTYADFCIEPSESGKYYVVTVTYSSGDSFGSSTGNLDKTEIFTNKEEAEKFAELIELHYEYEELRSNYRVKNIKDKRERLEKLKLILDENTEAYDSYSFTVNGKSYGCVWMGYFESIERVDVYELGLKNERVKYFDKVYI